jgi:hypothetical protein
MGQKPKRATERTSPISIFPGRTMREARFPISMVRREMARAGICHRLQDIGARVDCRSHSGPIDEPTAPIPLNWGMVVYHMCSEPNSLPESTPEVTPVRMRRDVVALEGWLFLHIWLGRCQKCNTAFYTYDR